jgi:hypothetical protein
MDKNIIFLFPLNKVLLDLKKEIERDETINLFEVDMIEEYQQVVGTLDSSITFSTDLKKTENYLNRCKKIVVSKQHKNILIPKDNPSGLVLSKMEKSGLDEVLSEFTPLKTLSHKIKVFFKSLEASQSFANFEVASQDNSIDTQSRQRIERLTVDDARPETADLLITKNLRQQLSNFKFRTNSNILSFNKTFQDLRKKIPDLKFERLMNLSETYDEDVINEDSIADTQNSQLHSSHEIDYLSMPEIRFFSPIKIFDPIVLFMEVLFDGLDIDFKRKYLQMVLLKRYNCKISFLTLGELADDQLNTNVPTWLNQARNSDYNEFWLPVLAGQVLQGMVVLHVTGSVDFSKMNELEFWCYLGKSLWI